MSTFRYRFDLSQIRDQNQPQKNRQFTERNSIFHDSFDPQKIWDETDAYNMRFTAFRAGRAGPGRLGRATSQFSRIL